MAVSAAPVWRADASVTAPPDRSKGRIDRVSEYVNDLVTTLAWAPDGKTLAVSSEASGSPMFVVNADGSGLSAVPGVEWGCAPAWRPE